ncbi:MULTISPECIES: sterol desaturase family protein [unclassified Myroides]|uniref:sterol desaturase family protein n=1 Tax=unclassified Myroides TaxID=2642485 RepID=UPI0015FDDD8B|nr:MULTISPECIES: sterol desaturase family protein [unclassified Myroides]MBB1149989.1 sterol desaturase family protein [Myroides sp. NP-2]MDM1407690.1 sterol desaturase family protein [Myroides sp. DF42-4-2]
MSQIEQLFHSDFKVITALGAVLNLALILASLSLYVIWHRLRKNSVEVNDVQPIVRSDVWAVLSTWGCNVLVFVLGAFTWKQGYLIVDFTAPKWGVVLIQLLVLILIVDFLMYCFHKLAHAKLLYRFIHQKHHEHIGVNALSLFVLSPFEALGFGAMLLVVLYVYPFHYVAVGIYLIINVIWGTIGHFNKVRALRTKGWVSWLGTASFHNRHHLDPQTNFGFYTTLWDRLFRTSKI